MSTGPDLMREGTPKELRSHRASNFTDNGNGYSTVKRDTGSKVESCLLRYTPPNIWEMRLEIPLQSIYPSRLSSSFHEAARSIAFSYLSYHERIHQGPAVFLPPAPRAKLGLLVVLSNPSR